jgi:hypothetical protein
MDLNESNINVESLKQMLQGKHTTQNKIQVTVGDYAPTVSRKVGEKWTDEDGNEWEQKEGYATKLGKEWQQELRKELSTFSNCPKEVCTCTLPNHLDKKMKAIHNMCFDCVIAMEHKLRIQGKYKEFYKSNISNYNTNILPSTTGSLYLEANFKEDKLHGVCRYYYKQCWGKLFK